VASKFLPNPRFVPAHPFAYNAKGGFLVSFMARSLASNGPSTCNSAAPYAGLNTVRLIGRQTGWSFALPEADALEKSLNQLLRDDFERLLGDDDSRTKHRGVPTAVEHLVRAQRALHSRGNS
jgi:hypothetical protein